MLAYAYLLHELMQMLGSLMYPYWKVLPNDVKEKGGQITSKKAALITVARCRLKTETHCGTDDGKHCAEQTTNTVDRYDVMMSVPGLRTNNRDNGCWLWTRQPGTLPCTTVYTAYL